MIEIPPGTTVAHFRGTLLAAADHAEVIQPESLREPVELWLRALEEQARSWRNLLGRPVNHAWAAAQAILAESG